MQYLNTKYTKKIVFKGTSVTTILNLFLYSLSQKLNRYLVPRLVKVLTVYY